MLNPFQMDKSIDINPSTIYISKHPYSSSSSNSYESHMHAYLVENSDNKVNHHRLAPIEIDHQLRLTFYHVNHCLIAFTNNISTLVTFVYYWLITFINSNLFVKIIINRKTICYKIDSKSQRNKRILFVTLIFMRLHLNTFHMKNVEKFVTSFIDIYKNKLNLIGI